MLTEQSTPAQAARALATARMSGVITAFRMDADGYHLMKVATKAEQRRGTQSWAKVLPTPAAVLAFLDSPTYPEADQ